jgi:hypothetical protein
VVGLAHSCALLRALDTTFPTPSNNNLSQQLAPSRFCQPLTNLSLGSLAAHITCAILTPQGTSAPAQNVLFSAAPIRLP